MTLGFPLWSLYLKERFPLLTTAVGVFARPIWNFPEQTNVNSGTCGDKFWEREKLKSSSARERGKRVKICVLCERSRDG